VAEQLERHACTDTHAKKVAEYALTILVNLTADSDVLRLLATNDRFLDAILARLMVSDSRSKIVKLLLIDSDRVRQSQTQICWQCFSQI
jgi:hypothetical protein